MSKMGTETEALQKGRLSLADLGAAWRADAGKVLRMAQGNGTALYRQAALRSYPSLLLWITVFFSCNPKPILSQYPSHHLPCGPATCHPTPTEALSQKHTCSGIQVGDTVQNPDLFTFNTRGCKQTVLLFPRPK